MVLLLLILLCTVSGRWRNTEYWWNDNDREKECYSEKKILVPFVHHTYYKIIGLWSKWGLRPDRVTTAHLRQNIKDILQYWASFLRVKRPGNHLDCAHPEALTEALREHVFTLDTEETTVTSTLFINDK